MPIFNVEIRATNKYKAGLAVTEYPLSIGGGWSDKMPAFLTPGGGVGTALVRNTYFFLKVVFHYLFCYTTCSVGDMK